MQPLMMLALLVGVTACGEASQSEKVGDGGGETIVAARAQVQEP